MKKLLALSIGLNLLLAVIVIRWTQQRPQVDHAQRNVSDAVPAHAVVSAPQPFRWSQLESTNYLTFIRNLRDIGCPAQTIRDIVTADVNNLYATRAQTLRQRWTESAPELQQLLAKLGDEKRIVLKELLGQESAATNASTESADSNTQATTDISVPLVWRDVDVSKLNLDQGQLEAIAQLRQNFVDRIGGENQDRNNPEYRERWQKAQPQIDQTLEGMIGGQAYMEYELLANATNR